MKFLSKSFSVFMAVSALATGAFADQIKQARSNDIAQSYGLSDDGRFYRKMPNGARCDITTGVQDFKVSQHKADAAVVYFIKEGSLYYLKNLQNAYGKQCPPAEKKLLTENVKRENGKYQYHVVSNTNTDLVNTVLGYNGRFSVWAHSGSPLTANGIESYELNQCYGAKGKAFNSYMVFLRTYNGTIIKVKGNRNDYGQIESKSDDSQYYGTVKSFISRNNVCDQ